MLELLLAHLSGEIKNEWVNGKAQKITGSEADKALSFVRKNMVSL